MSRFFGLSCIEEVFGNGKSFVDFMDPEDAINYNNYWKNKYPQNYTPNDKFIHYRYYNGKVESHLVIYDDYGRQKFRIDFGDHSMPDQHSMPHLYGFVYDKGSYLKGIEYTYNFLED